MIDTIFLRQGVLGIQSGRSAGSDGTWDIEGMGIHADNTRLSESEVGSQ